MPPRLLSEDGIAINFRELTLMSLDGKDVAIRHMFKFIMLFSWRHWQSGQTHEELGLTSLGLGVNNKEVERVLSSLHSDLNCIVTSKGDVTDIFSLITNRHSAP